MKPTELKHTPTPWKVERSTEDVFVSDDIIDADGNSIIRINGSRWHKIADSVDIAEADFIVNAVNAYEAMLAALKLMQASLRAEGRINATVDAAIAKAEKGE